MKPILTTCALLVGLLAAAQAPRKTLAQRLDSMLARSRAPRDWLFGDRFRYDSGGFRPLAGFLPDSLQPARGTAYWEINTWTGTRWRNDYRSDHGQAPDSVVLTRAQAGFGMYMAPGSWTWYLSVRSPRGLYSVHDTAALRRFLGPIDNPWKAALWLYVQGPADILPPPLQYPPARWKAVEGGWLFRMEFTVDSCPISSAEVAYFVGRDGRVVYVRVIWTQVSGGCA